MMPLVKLGGARAALRGTSSTSSSRMRARKPQCSSLAGSRFPRGHADQPKGTAAIFSVARVPREALSTKEAPFSAVSMGQTVEAGRGKKHWLSGGRWELSQCSVRSLLTAFSEAMMKERRPLQRIGLRIKTNLSNLCGHASFVILAFAYLEADVLMLRAYAAGGIGLSVLFQFYRPQPLWISISWNGLFMLINVAMIGLLLKERNDAGKLSDDPEQARVYTDVFEPVELSPIDFLRLVDLGERREFRPRDTLSEAGKMQEDVLIILEGTAEVYSKGVMVGELQSQQFVGSMAFQQFISNNSSSAASSTSSASSSASSSAFSFSSTSSSSSLQQRRTPQQVVHRATLARTDRARRRTASSSASGARSVSGGGESPTGSSTTTTASELSRGLMTSSDSSGKKPPTSATQSGRSNHVLDEDFDDEVDNDNYVAGGGGVFAGARRAGEAALDRLHHDSVVGTVAKSIVPVLKVSAESGGSAELKPSSTTVTATTDMVAYAWNMHMLKAFIKRHPEAGVALQTAMSADLSRKIEASRGQDDRYRIWLQAALAAGEVTPIERDKLERYRETHGISMDEHRALLKQLDWEVEDFEAGFRKGVAHRDGSKKFLKHEALERQELAKGEVEDKTRQHRRLVRKSAGFVVREHKLALEKQGCTADDYGVRRKGKAAELVGVNVMNELHEEEEEQRSGRPQVARTC